MSTRDKGVVIFAIALFIISGYLAVTLATPHLLTAEQWKHERTCGIIWVCQNFTLYDAVSDQQLDTSAVVKIYSKYGFFAYNPIYYEINMTDLTGEMKEAYFVYGDSNESFKEFDNMSYNEIVDLAKLEHILVPLQKTPQGTFQVKDFMLFSGATTIKMKELLMLNNGGWKFSNLADFNIQVDSSKQGIAEKQGDETQITNEILLGLTYLGVSLAPALLGSDMILRVLFEGGENSEKKSKPCEDTRSKSPEPPQE